MSAPALRLFVLAGAMTAGIFAAEALPPGPAVAGTLGFAALGAIVMAAVRARMNGHASLLVAALLFGAFLAAMRLCSLEASALGAGGIHGADAMLDGRVLAQPSLAGGVLRFPLGVSRATIDGGARAVRERVQVSIRPPPGVWPDIGDRLRLDARLAPLLGTVRGPGAEAVRASAARLRWAGISARAYARPGGLVRLGGPSAPLDVIGRAGRRAVSRPGLRIPPRQAGLLLGVTIGDTSRLDPVMEEQFRTTGLTHLLAVSGENLALFLGAVALALRKVKAGRRTSIAVLGLATACFVSITRFEPSVMRAGVMAAVGLCGLALGARRETPAALATAAIVLMTLDPFIVHAMGFQLSALATLGLLTIGPPLQRVFTGKIGAAAAVTLAAQLAVAPLIALTFHTFSLISIVANVLAVPAVGPATVLGILAAPLGTMWSGLGLACVTFARPFLWWMGAVASALSRVPHASVGTPSGIAGAFVAGGLVIAAIRVRRVTRPPRFAAVLVAVGLIAAQDVWAGALAPPIANGLEITAIDVGQGDAILVRAPGGATMLVDGGPDSKLVLAKLRERRISRIDLLVLTHPHADHVDGLAAIAERLDITRALDPGLDADLPAYARFKSALAERHVPRDIVRAGARYALGPALVEVLAPAEPLFIGTSSDLNNNSVVMRVRYGKAVALLGGELQEEGQLRLIQAENLRAHVFKVPHHGSARMVREFTLAVHASAALIPVGPNDFGHPSRACLDALRDAGTAVYRTDRSGDVSIVLDAAGRLSVREQHRDAAAA